MAGGVDAAGKGSHLPATVGLPENVADPLMSIFSTRRSALASLVIAIGLTRVDKLNLLCP